MTNVKNPKYDLEERTAKFGEDIIEKEMINKIWHLDFDILLDIRN